MRQCRQLPNEAHRAASCSTLQSFSGATPRYDTVSQSKHNQERKCTGKELSECTPKLNRPWLFRKTVSKVNDQHVMHRIGSFSLSPCKWACGAIENWSSCSGVLIGDWCMLPTKSYSKREVLPRKKQGWLGLQRWEVLPCQNASPICCSLQKTTCTGKGLCFHTLFRFWGPHPLISRNYSLKGQRTICDGRD